MYIDLWGRKSVNGEEEKFFCLMEIHVQQLGNSDSPNYIEGNGAAGAEIMDL